MVVIINNSYTEYYETVYQNLKKLLIYYEKYKVKQAQIYVSKW